MTVTTFDKWLDSSQDEVLSYAQARKLLRKKCGATDEEIALWAYHDRLAVYSAEPWNGKHRREPSNWLWDQDHHASAARLLAQFRFSRREIDGFDPAAAGRYVSFQQTLERLSSLSGPEYARAMLAREIHAGRLMPFHYVTGGVPWEPEQQASGRFPSLEQAMFSKSGIDSLVKSEFGEAAATPKEAARGTGPVEAPTQACPSAEQRVTQFAEREWTAQHEANWPDDARFSRTQMIDHAIDVLSMEKYGAYSQDAIRPWINTVWEQMRAQNLVPESAKPGPKGNRRRKPITFSAD